MDQLTILAIVFAVTIVVGILVVLLRRHITATWATVASDRTAIIIGWVIAIALLVGLVGFVAIVFVQGFGGIVLTMRADGMDARLWAFCVVLGVALTIAVVASCLPVIIRSYLGEGMVWWQRVVFPSIALIAIGFLLWLIVPVGILEAFNTVEHAVRGGGFVRTGTIGAGGALPADLAAVRERAVSAWHHGELRLNDPAAITERIGRIRRYRTSVERYAREQHLDPRKLEAVMAVESHGNPRATSPRNARGLMQFIDATARDFGGPCGVVNPREDSYDPEKSICMGARYLRKLLDAEAGGSFDEALAAYNGGPERLTGHLDVLPPGTPRSFWAAYERGAFPTETRGYVPKVLAWEGIIAHHDQTGAPPPRGTEPLLAHGMLPGTAGGGGGGAGALGLAPATPGAASTLAPMPSLPVVIVPAAPAANTETGVWYTARAGDRYGYVVLRVLGDQNPDEVHVLNAATVARDDPVLPSGHRIYLPATRYAFHAASGGESFHDIAQRYRMTTTQLLAWSGRHSPLEVWRHAMSECPPDGCAGDRSPAGAGSTFLVRVQ